MTDAIQNIRLRSTDGGWEATQTGLETVGTGDNPGRAVEDLGRKIAEEAYE